MRFYPREQAFRLNTLLAVTLAMSMFVQAAQAAKVKTLYDFGSQTNDGRNPQAGVIADASGNLYGTTQSGGSSGFGTVFKLSPGKGDLWTESVLYSFAGGPSDGASPQAGLLMDAAGNLYGTTTNGGASDEGTAFALTPGMSGTYTETVIHDFTGSPDGKKPLAGLIRDAFGNLFGTTYYGGTYNDGTVFRLNPGKNGKFAESVIWSFSGCPNGLFPGAGVIIDSSGTLYGSTFSGGGDCIPYGYGTVFSLVPGDGGYQLNILYRFGGGSDGTSPYGLLMDFNGVLYGAVSGGGAHGDGDIFELTPAGGGSYTFNVLYAFQGGTDGATPEASVFRSNDSIIYGTTAGGAKAGTVFRLAGTQERPLYDFSGGSDGATPLAGLISPRPSVLYGTTSNGGTHGGGTVFELSGH